MKRNRCDSGFKKTIGSGIRFCLLMLCLIAGLNAHGQISTKAQQYIDAVKAANYCEDEDYHTDGQRVVWVKSWKNWVPEDMAVIQKEAPDILEFLGKAIRFKRYDMLEQLLPNYYQEHGGVQAFARDILKQSATMQANTTVKTHSH